MYEKGCGNKPLSGRQKTEKSIFRTQLYIKMKKYLHLKYRIKSVLLGLLIIFFSTISSYIFAQGEANWWYFGYNAGLDFTGGSPVAVTNGQLYTHEGCASISDATGNLLFYTDGIKVWNRTHVQMPNGFGLMGNPSATQSGVIIQKPGSTTNYYIFTVDAYTKPNGIRYSEVDMALNTGLGDVKANKNILLNTPSCEKITGIRHCNNTDVWVVTHDWNSKTFRTYLVTPTGVNLNPVLSNVGLVVFGKGGNSQGYLKASPDGTKLASATDVDNRFELFDFNNSTGIVSNQILFSQTIATSGAYGVEFSPDGTKMYSSNINPGNIYQYDLCAGSNSEIANSGVKIGTSSSKFGALQLGPDKKIYVARDESSWLGVINNPNTIGVGCNYVDNGVNLAGRVSRLGLPNFVPWYFKPTPPPFLVSVNCLNINFTAPAVNITNCSSSTNAIISVSWNFGDPISGLNDTSTVSNPSHHFSSAGPYTVSLVLHYACSNDTLRQTVTPTNLGNPNIVVTVLAAICTGDSIFLDNAWRKTAGIYHDTLTTTAGCDSIVKTTLTINPIVNVAVSKTICQGDSILLGGIYQNISGAYYDTLTTIGGCDSITTLDLTVYPSYNFVMQVQHCDSILYDGIRYTRDTLIIDNRLSIHGCDSITTIDLHLSSISERFALAACSSYTWNGNIYTDSGTYTYQGQTAMGCDSIVTLDLTISHVLTKELTVQECERYTWNGTTYTDSGIYTYQGQSVMGCDSIVTLDLTIYQPAQSSEFLSACDSLEVHGQILRSSGVYTFQLNTVHGCDSTVTLNFTTLSQIQSQEQSACDSLTWAATGDTYTHSGSYFAKHTNLAGCDSIQELRLQIHPSYIINEKASACEQYTWSVNHTTYTEGGSYTFPLNTRAGCDSILNLSLHIDPVFEQRDTVIEASDYTWPINAETYSISGLYSAAYQSQSACDSVYWLYLTIKNEIDIFFPNIINPSGHQSHFTLFSNNRSVIVETMSIFDRWGNLLFTNQNFPVNNPNSGWNGKFGGKDVVPGVYVWIALLRLPDGSTTTKQGDVTVVR